MSASYIEPPIATLKEPQELVRRGSQEVRARKLLHASDTEALRTLSLAERAALGAAGGIGASCFCHPLDVIRVQMQVAQYDGTASAAKAIFERGGIGGLYAGLSAAWLRQVTYGSGRLGIYSYLLNRDKQQRVHGDSPSFLAKLGMGTFSGAAGAAIGSPAELALVRMGADSSIADPALRRNYSSSIDCVIRVAREEGVSALWTGAAPTILRAAFLNSSLLAITSQLKPEISQRTGWEQTAAPCMFSATLVASFFSTLCSQPFDVVKSRIQQAAVGEYAGGISGMLDCARTSVAAEGPLVLLRGFMPAFIKLAPFSMISLTFLEKLTNAYTGGRSSAL
tara:strand:+ start:1284 stop:2297 length:1014 start_codon:yes stop_codon:yes gene_type:complete